MDIDFSFLKSELVYYGLYLPLASLLTFALQKYKHRLEEKKLEKKYPISGDYITIFEDMKENGERIIDKAFVSLKQKGRSINGDEIHSGGKIWRLEGNMSNKDGYIYGQYTSPDIHDKTTGNFFLEIFHDNNINTHDMNGIWSGYDPNAKKNIDSGSYKFRAIIKFKIETVTEKYLLPISSILSNRNNISSLDTLYDKNSLSLVAIYNKKIISYLCSINIQKNEIDNNVLNIEDYQQLKYINDEISIITSISTLREYENRGVASQLVQKYIKEVNNKNIIVIINTNDEKNELVNILKRNSFQLLKKKDENSFPLVYLLYNVQ